MDQRAGGRLHNAGVGEPVHGQRGRLRAIIVAEEQIHVAHRPTPRHGWTRASDPPEELRDPERDSAVLRVQRSKVDATVSLVGLDSAPHGEPAESLPWSPSAATPGVFQRDRSSVTSAAGTRGVALGDLALARTLPAEDSDRTQVDTVDELSLSGAEATDGEPPALDPLESKVAAVEPWPVAVEQPAQHSPRKRVPPAAWVAVAACGVFAIGWSVLPLSGAREATAATTAHSPDALASPAAASALRRPEAPPPQVADAVAHEAPATSSDDADAEERVELDDTRTAAAARARELVDEGRALQQRKKYALAEERHREALSVLPGYPRALRELVRIAMAQGKSKQAVALARQLQRARPSQVAYLVLLGDAYDSAGMRKQARAAWQKAARKGSAAARSRLKR
jgi:hypothetical protein